jgi:branched-subunit amino acid transport protein
VTFWLVMIAGGAITFLTRLSFIAAEGRFAVPAWFRAMLPFVPIATLTAIIAPELLRQHDAWDVSLRNPRLLAGLLAIAVAAVRRSVLLTISFGFAAFALLHWLL